MSLAVVHSLYIVCIAFNLFEKYLKCCLIARKLNIRIWFTIILIKQMYFDSIPQKYAVSYLYIVDEFILANFFTPKSLRVTSYFSLFSASRIYFRISDVKFYTGPLIGISAPIEMHVTFL